MCRRSLHEWSDEERYERFDAIAHVLGHQVDIVDDGADDVEEDRVEDQGSDVFLLIGLVL